MTLRASGALVYWNAHTGFGEIDLDGGHGRVGIYRADLLRAGIRIPQVGDRFYFNAGVAANGVTTAADLCPDEEAQKSPRFGRVEARTRAASLMVKSELAKASRLARLVRLTSAPRQVPANG